MVSYADTSACLRATILRYFGDAAAKEPCGSCGNCSRLQPIGDDDRLLVRKILSGVARAGERYGRRKIAAMLAGEVADLPEMLVGLSTTGLLREMPVAMVERWIDVATAAGLLSASDDKYRTLSLTTVGRDVMTGRVQDVLIAAPRESAGALSAKEIPSDARGCSPIVVGAAAADRRCPSRVAPRRGEAECHRALCGAARSHADCHRIRAPRLAWRVELDPWHRPGQIGQLWRRNLEHRQRVTLSVEQERSAAPRVVAQGRDSARSRRDRPARAHAGRAAGQRVAILCALRRP